MIGRGRHAGRLWWPWLALWTAVGLGIRLATVFGRPNRVAGGDAYYDHNAANLLVAGHGFINPFLYYPHDLHHQVQTASWPPLFVFVLVAASLVGAKSFFAQRIWCCIVGAGAIVLCGYVGREIGGRRVGLIAALLVAVYPNIWMSDELGLSETLSPPSWWRSCCWPRTGSGNGPESGPSSGSAPRSGWRPSPATSSPCSRPSSSSLWSSWRRPSRGGAGSR